MKTLCVLTTLVALGAAAPSLAAVGHAAAYIQPATAAVVPAGPAVAHVAESYHAGPAVAKTVVQHGVVGSRTVQVGSQPVQVGHQYRVAGQTVHQQAPYSYVAGAPVNTQQTVALPAPALPVASPAAAVIPPAPVNYGAAPADTVTQQRVLAPARAHTRITPKVTRIEPELHVNRYNVDVPVPAPYPVHRDVVVTKQVQRPYQVDVPRAVPVAKPYKVHPVHQVVETPVVRQHTVSVHQAPAAVTLHH